MAGATHKDYDEIAKRKMLEYPIVYLLAHLGKPVSLPGGKLSGVTSSPFREDKSPSFSIGFNKKANCWMAHDLSSQKGWNNLSLVKEILGCDGAHAWDYLASIVGTIPTEKMDEIRRQTAAVADASASANHILYVRKGISLNYLLDYTRARGINTSVLNRYCSQITFTVGDTERKHYAIGFPNCSAGWVLREADSVNRETGKLYPRHVRCTNSDCSHFAADGSRISENELPASSSVSIFEGFFDFLAWVSWRMEEDPRNLTKMPCDVIVLNSTTNLDRALPRICRYDKVYSFTDLDRAGRECEERCREALAQSNAADGGCRELVSCTAKFIPEGTAVRRLDGETIPAKDISDAYKAHRDALRRKSMELTGNRPVEAGSAEEENYSLIHKR